MNVRYPTGERRLARLGAMWGIGMLVALVGTACQVPQVNRVDAAVPSARAFPPTTSAVIPTLTPVAEGGSGGITVVVLPTATLAPGLHRVLLTIPTIA
jgi:hypothetical protein